MERCLGLELAAIFRESLKFVIGKKKHNTLELFVALSTQWQRLNGLCEAHEGKFCARKDNTTLKDG